MSEGPVELIETSPQTRGQFFVVDDDLTVSEVVLALDAVQLMTELGRITVPAIDECKVRVVHTRQAWRREKLAPQVRLNAIDPTSIRLAQERDYALARGHGEM